MNVDRYDPTDHDGEPVYAIARGEMHDIARVVNAAERIAEDWQAGKPLDQRQMRALRCALGDLGDWG